MMSKKESVKSEKTKFKIDYEGLQSYLKTLKATDFRIFKYQTGSNSITYPCQKIKNGISVRQLSSKQYQAQYEQIIQIGQPFLCDVLGNDLSIIVLTNRKYKLPDNSRSINAKFVCTVIKDCSETYGTSLNGYWVIPPQFISYN